MSGKRDEKGSVADSLKKKFWHKISPNRQATPKGDSSARTEVSDASTGVATISHRGRGPIRAPEREDGNKLPFPAQKSASPEVVSIASTGADAAHDEDLKIEDEPAEPVKPSMSPRPTCWERATESLKAHSSQSFKKLTEMEGKLRSRQEDLL